jgi:hypothetical protein
METMQDKAFLAETQKLDMMLRPKSGEELTQIVKRVAATPPDVLKKAAQVLEWSE